jgi:hypothetical protein
MIVYNNNGNAGDYNSSSIRAPCYHYKDIIPRVIKSKFHHNYYALILLTQIL